MHFPRSIYICALAHETFDGVQLHTNRNNNTPKMQNAQNDSKFCEKKQKYNSNFNADEAIDSSELDVRIGYVQITVSIVLQWSISVQYSLQQSLVQRFSLILSALYC